MERSVHYDALSAESIAELAQLSERLGMEALIAVNKRAMELEKMDVENQMPAHRMTLGVYFYTEPSASTEFSAAPGRAEESP
jgi:hypothetical protein